MSVKRFVINVKRREKTDQDQTDAWEVVAYCADSMQALHATRIMRGCSPTNKPALIFPVPPEEEVLDRDNPSPYDMLCCASNADDIQKLYKRIADHTLQEGDSLTFGRYLFAALLGDTLWNKLTEEAGSAHIELALRWSCKEWVLSRLPWEMMSSDAKTFLAADPKRLIAMTRIVATSSEPKAPGQPLQLQLPLKILFIIGTSLDDERIRPGAEYLGLLQHLKAKDQYFALMPYVLQRASSEMIEEAIKSFQPAVIHFICHGKLDKSGGSLVVASKDQKGTDELDGARLYTMLTRSGEQQPPRIVVLNACKSGAPAAQAGASLAADLVSRGVPMVAAMNGEIADHACRLFTRRFYEALLSGKSVANATAEGRWAGIAHTQSPERKVDWAYPTLFLADSASSEVIITQNATWLKLQEIAANYHKLNNPSIFCGRLEIMEDHYRKLITPRKNGTVVKRVMAVKVDNQTISVKDGKYGKTRLLKELAAQAVRDGHIPCLLSYKDGEEPPRNRLELIMAFVTAIDKTREYFGLGTKSQNLIQVSQHELLTLVEANLLALVPAPVMSVGKKSILEVQYSQKIAKIRKILKDLNQAQRDEVYDAIDSDSVKNALQYDLKTLVEDVRQKYPDLPSLMVLVLIDEVHRFDSAARELTEMLGLYGLGTDLVPVPVIFTFSSNQQEEQAKYSGALKALADLLESRSIAEEITLGPLSQTEDDLLPYLQYLLHYYKGSLVINRAAREDKIKLFFQRLHGKVKGVPSRLKNAEENDDVEAHIDAWTDNDVLEKADDERIMELHRIGEA
jgi:hypothetical protein